MSSKQEGNVPRILSLHHSALRVVDAEQTRHFYEDVVGLPLEAACIFDDAGLGVVLDYMHLFHRMGDGDFAAFFDVPDWVNPGLYRDFSPLDQRSAFTIRDAEAFAALQQRLTEEGIAFSGPVDHGFMQSIQCVDPSGINLEFVLKNPRYEELLAQEEAQAHGNFADWMAQAA